MADLDTMRDLDSDGVRVGELQNQFEEMDGWNAWS